MRSGLSPIEINSLVTILLARAGKKKKEQSEVANGMWERREDEFEESLKHYR